MGRFKVGIIGCGGIARQKHVPALTANKDTCEIVAFCDIIKERAEELAASYGNEKAKIFTDYKELLKLDLDAVHVCTPNRSHSFITVDALKSGKNVLCEKPMAINYEEAQKMVCAAKESGKLLSIGYQNRYRKDSLYLKRECEKGVFGDIYYAKATALRRRAVPTWGVFLKEDEQGGGPLIDIGTHALDLTLWMMDNYKPKYCVGTAYKKFRNVKEAGNAWGDWDASQFTVEDSAFGFVVMENGATVYLESSWALNTLEVREAVTSLCGTKAGADMIDGLRINGVENDAQYVLTPSFAAGGVDFNAGSPAATPESRECKTFYNAVAGKAPLTVLPEQAACVTRILDGIYESSRTGGPVYFK